MTHPYKRHYHGMPATRETEALENIIDFKKLTTPYLSLLCHWFKFLPVQSYYHLRGWSPENTRDLLLSGINQKSTLHSFMCRLNRVPFGLIQFYPAIDCPWLSQCVAKNKLNNSAGIDLFVASPHMRNQGLGYKMLHGIMDTILENFDACWAAVPHENITAIHCFEKANFELLDVFDIFDTFGNQLKVQLMIKQK